MCCPTPPAGSRAFGCLLGAGRWLREDGHPSEKRPERLQCTGSGRQPRSTLPSLLPTSAWGLRVPRSADCPAQRFSRKRSCVAAIQTVGDPGVPLLESLQEPPELKRGEHPGVAATSVSYCCFPAEPSSYPCMVPGKRPPCTHILLCAEAGSCLGGSEGFIPSFQMIRKPGQESSSQIPPLEDLPTQSSLKTGFAFFCLICQNVLPFHMEGANCHTKSSVYTQANNGDTGRVSQATAIKQASQ